MNVFRPLFLQKKFFLFLQSFFIECCQIRPDVSNGLFSDSKAQILYFCPPVSQTQNRSHVKLLVMQPIHLLSNTIKTFPNIVVLFHLQKIGRLKMILSSGESSVLSVLCSG